MKNPGLLRSKRTVAALAAAGALTLVAACGGGGESVTGGSKKDGKVTITMGLFGVMGIEETGLLERYEKENPGVDIKAEIAGDEQTYYTALQTRLAAGKGLKDIQGIEIARAKEITETQADKFADFSGMTGTDHFLPWKQSQITTSDGKVLGLGTDIGPMAVCYRKDYFEKAGLPTDREEVGKLWAGDWAKLIEVGEDYQKKAPKGTTFMDSPGGLISAILSSEKERFYNSSGEIIYKTNPAVKRAFDLTAEAAEKGLVGAQTQFQPSWDQTIANNKFAAIACPPWMLGYIKGKSKADAAGKWDVALAPKSGNWGGSFLTVPKSGKNVEEAKKLAAWLTAPEQQAKLFAVQGSFPSSPPAYSMPEVTDAKNDMTGDAPIGKIFAEAAKQIPLQVIGPKDQIIGQGLADNGVILVTKGKSPEEAWETATKTIDNNLDK